MGQFVINIYLGLLYREVLVSSGHEKESTHTAQWAYVNPKHRVALVTKVTK